MSRFVLEQGEFGNKRLVQDRTGSFVGPRSGTWPGNVPETEKVLLVLQGRRQSHPSLGDLVVAFERELTQAERDALAGRCEHDTGLVAAALIDAWRLAAARGLEPVETAGDQLALDDLLSHATEARKALADAVLVRGDYHPAAVDALGHLDRALDDALRRWLAPRLTQANPTIRTRAIRLKTGASTPAKATRPRTRSEKAPVNAAKVSAGQPRLQRGSAIGAAKAVLAVAASLLLAALLTPGPAAVPSRAEGTRELAPGVLLVGTPGVSGTTVQLDGLATRDEAQRAVHAMDPALALVPAGDGIFLLESTAVETQEE